MLDNPARPQPGTPEMLDKDRGRDACGHGKGDESITS